MNWWWSVKVGDLIYEDYYGHGIIIGIEARDYTIYFYEARKTGVIDSHLMEFVEVISESR